MWFWFYTTEPPSKRSAAKNGYSRSLVLIANWPIGEPATAALKKQARQEKSHRTPRPSLEELNLTPGSAGQNGNEERIERESAGGKQKVRRNAPEGARGAI